MALAAGRPAAVAAPDLPHFANDDNRALEAQVKQNETLVASIEAELAETTRRVDDMAGHLKSVQQELAATQELVRSKNKETETEDHLKRLAEREKGRIAIELTKIQQEQTQIQDKINDNQNMIFRGEKQLEEVKSRMNWDQEELDQWVTASKQKEEDNLALERYTKADESRIKEKTLAVEKLTKKAAESKTALEREVTETQAAQIQLEKTAEDFRNLHAERQQLIKQWEGTIEAMSKRDQEITAAEARLESEKSGITEREAVIADKKHFLEGELANNKGAEKNIALADRRIAKSRDDLGRIRNDVMEFTDQVETMRASAQAAATDLATKRGQIQFLKDDLVAKRSRIERLTQSRAEAAQRARDVAGQTTTLEEQMQQLEAIHRREEQRVRELDRKLHDIKEVVFRHAQELFKLRQTEANFIAEITGAQAARKNLVGSIHRMDAEAQKQAELIYNQEFQLQQLERKVARAQGERSDEEKEALIAQTKQLQQVLEEQTAVQALLSNQLKKLQDDIRRAKRRLDTGASEEAGLVVKIESLELEAESAQRIVKDATAQKERLMVEANVLKLEVRRLRELLNARADEVLGLENRKHQLQMSMEERVAEIQVHREVLRAKLKSAEEERHTAKLELRDRLLKVEKLSNKYDIMMNKYNSENAEGERSQAYFVIQAAQQREELMREGDELSAKIAKAEKEIRALENTLTAMGDTNVEYQQSLRKVDVDSDEVEQKVALEEQYRAAMERYKQKRRGVRDLQEELAALEQTLVAAESEQRASAAAIEELNQQKAGLDRELGEQDGKIDRAQKAYRKAVKAHRAEKGTADGQQTAEEQEAIAREVKESNRNALLSLAALGEGAPELGAALDQELARAGITLPGATKDTGSPASSRPSSAGSQRSVSSRASVTSSQNGSLRGARMTAGRGGGGAPGVATVRQPMRATATFAAPTATTTTTTTTTTTAAPVGATRPPATTGRPPSAGPVRPPSTGATRSPSAGGSRPAATSTAAPVRPPSTGGGARPPSTGRTSRPASGGAGGGMGAVGVSTQRAGADARRPASGGSSRPGSAGSSASRGSQSRTGAKVVNVGL